MSSVVLPLAIVIIMIAMGMSLTVADFRRVLSQPKAVGVGLLCQLIVLPILGIAVATLLPLEGVFAVSIVLLAASPGGTTSNLISHAAELDRALSVTLTAISNTVSWLTIPLLLSFALRRFANSSQAVEFPVGDVMIQVAGLTIVPIIIGMVIRRFRPNFAEATKNGSKIFAGVFLLVVILALVIQNWEVVRTEAPRFALAFILLNAVALLAGFIIAKLFKLDQRQATTIGIETGLQNSTLAITIALAILNNNEMTIVPALYGIWMLATGFAFAFMLNRTSRAHATA
ncbi:MAG: bile acid:sodium symporter family protein [Chloroflexi bacterium]|nr:bile acid:sodium symporter family protein [Chloroflexota bacterium]